MPRPKVETWAKEPALIPRQQTLPRLVATNHFLRDLEPWTALQGVDNGLNDLYGLLHIEGEKNSVFGNHFSEVVDSQTLTPAGATPVIIRIASGNSNYIATNHAVASDVRSTSNDSCFEAQVDELLTTEAAKPITTVLVDATSQRSTILDSGTAARVEVDVSINALRVTPGFGDSLN